MDSGSGGTAYNGRGAWTARYRRLLSFDEVRRTARSMGLRTEDDWEALGVPKAGPLAWVAVQAAMAVAALKP